MKLGIGMCSVQVVAVDDNAEINVVVGVVSSHVTM
jgi:hypothetical protein